MEHELKCWPEYFDQVADGRKPFEVRKADRSYNVGDVLRLREWDPAIGLYSGREVHRRVTSILRGGSFGVERGYIVMGFSYCG